MHTLKDFGELKIGQYISVKTKEQLEKDYESLDNVPGMFSDNMVKYCKKRFKITDSIHDKIKECVRNNCDSNYIIRVEDKENHMDWGFSIAMFNIGFGENKIIQEVKEEKKSFSIIEENKKQEIIDYMISLIDRPRFETMIKIGMRTDRRFKIADGVVDDYLKRWAEAKYEFFLLFDNKLFIEKDFEEDLSYNDMNILRTQLMEKYPKYAPIIYDFSPHDFISNECTGYSSIDKYRIYCKKYFTSGMKLTKFFSSFFNDLDFDIELSQMLQNKKVRVKTRVSIDPYDFFTMSINKHGWDSCYNINDGCYSNGAYSALLDDVSMIAYSTNDQEYNYNIKGFDFKGNSKKSRWLISFDKNTSSIIYSRGQGSPSKKMYDLSIDMLKDLVIKKIGKVNWITTGASSRYIKKRNRYNHFEDDLSTIYYTSYNCIFDMDIKEMLCPICGNPINLNINEKLNCCNR